MNQSSVNLEHLPPRVQKLMKGIAGIKVTVHKMEGIFRLDQNSNTTHFQNIIRVLKKQNSSIVDDPATLMENKKL